MIDFMTDGKLVRDKIPEIIRADGLDPVVHVADPEEFAARLRDKLREETEEFLTSGDPQELADILEIVHALAWEIGLTPQKIEELRVAKAAERGSFNDRIIWSGNR